VEFFLRKRDEKRLGCTWLLEKELQLGGAHSSRPREEETQAQGKEQLSLLLGGKSGTERERVARTTS